MTCKHNGALNPRATALCLALLLSTTAVIAADTPVYPDGNKIEGVWDSRLTYRSCETGVALFTGQSLLAYAHGGVLTTITTGAAP